jgi:hypothetical protein
MIKIYDPNLGWPLLSSTSLIYDHSFIVPATVITIVNYDCKTFMLLATG